MSVTGLVVVGVAVVAARALTLWRKRNRPGPAGETRRPPPSPSPPRSEESAKPSGAPGDADSGLGPLGRLGTWMARHARAVTVAWVLAMLALAYPISQVEQSLAGFGWAATGSESVQARDRIGDHFAGRNAAAFMVVVHSDSKSLEDPAFQETAQRVTGLLRDHPEAIASVVAPKSPWISPDRGTTVVLGGAARDANGMVEAAEQLKGELADAGQEGVEVDLTGLPGIWSDFNEDNKKSMFFAEAVSWPIVLVALVLAFGSLASGLLPLPLTILGLVASGGVLWIGTQVIEISLWAMNFALMFSLALGIDYALFVVMRFRQALFEQEMSAVQAVGHTMDTAGKAVLFSGLTVMASLLGVLFVPSLAFRTMSIGIVVSVIFVLTATLTLLPVLLAKLGPRVDSLTLPRLTSTAFRSPRSAAWARHLWAHIPSSGASRASCCC